MGSAPGPSIERFTIGSASRQPAGGMAPARSVPADAPGKRHGKARQNLSIPAKSDVSMQPPVLLIIDVQAAFSIPPSLVADIEKYGRRFRRRIFTKFVNRPGSLFRTHLGHDSCAPGSPDTRLLIPPSAGDLVFTKASYGLRPYHLRKMRALGIREVEVCGVDTDACVLGVMFSLFDAQIAPKLVRRLCWSSQNLHREALEIMQAQFALPAAPRPKRRKT